MGNNYTLNCKINKNIDGDLQASVSYIDKDLLIINFETGFDSKIKLIENYTNFNKVYYPKKSAQIKAFTIIVISLVIILVVVGAVAAAIIILKRKRKTHNKYTNESSREEIKFKEV